MTATRKQPLPAKEEGLFKQVCQVLCSRRRGMSIRGMCETFRIRGHRSTSCRMCYVLRLREGRAQVVKMHEGRQYKKALKLVDQVRSCPFVAFMSSSHVLHATTKA